MGLRYFTILALIFGAVTARAAERPVVILVPGFFNSLVAGYVRANPTDGLEIKPYFSKAIIRTVESSGYKAVVVSNLLPLGTLEGNGARLLRFIKFVQAENPNSPIHLVAHSAGGLYSMYALTQDPSLNVLSLTTIATPYGGADLVDNVARAVPLLETISDLISLRSLAELKRERVAGFLRRVRLPDHLKLRLYGAQQKRGGVLGWRRAEYLSWPMALTSKFTQGESDGVVSVESALGEGLMLATRTGRALNISSTAAGILPLEHWEQVHDWRIFTLVGVTDAQSIERSQVQSFQKILRHLNQ